MTNLCPSCREPLDYPSGDGCAAMTKHKEKTVGYVTGQIYGWNGGECPVHPKTNIKVWFRRDPSTMGYAGGWVWAHEDLRGDIVCFQVITPYAEPKTIWVNEYVNGDLYAYPSENMAKTYSHTNHTRIGVKYVEGKE